MMQTKLDRDRDMIINQLIKAARNHRAKTGQDYEDIVMVSIPAGVRHFITANDIAQLDFMNIRLEDR